MKYDSIENLGGQVHVFFKHELVAIVQKRPVRKDVIIKPEIRTDDLVKRRGVKRGQTFEDMMRIA